MSGTQTTEIIEQVHKIQPLLSLYIIDKNV